MDSIKVNWEILLSLIWWVGTISSGRSVERNLELFLFQKMPWQPFRRKGNKHRPLTEVSILSLPKELESQVQGLWPKFPFVCLPLHQGLVFPGWRWDLFCTRNDCAAQLQRRKPCQVSFGKFAWNWTEFEDFFPTQGTEWTSIAGRLDFSAQLRHMQRCRQQLDKFHWVSSSLSTKWGLSILWQYYCRPITFVLDLISFATGMWWRRVIL